MAGAHERNRAAEAPNALTLRAEPLERKALEKYRSRRTKAVAYDTAARLWAVGVEFENALAIVQEAFKAVAEDAEG